MGPLLRPPPAKRRPGHWVALDYAATALLAVVYGVAFRAQAYLHGVPQWADAALVAAAVLPAGVRRRWPRSALALVTAGGSAVIAISSSPVPPIAVAFVMYLIPLRLPRRAARRALAATLLVIAAALAVFAFLPHGFYGPGSVAEAARQLAEGGVLVIAAWVVGYAVREQRAYEAGQREQARQRVLAQIAEARRATSAERLRIARELHDVVAHSMSLIAVQAGVANYVIGDHPEEAARTLTSIEQTSRGAMREMRALLEMLRAEPDDKEETVPVPAPGLADLDGLAAGAAEAGVLVDLDVRGKRPSLSPGLNLAVYRVIQEALTNVIKHAATDRCRVTVTCQHDALTVEITDSGPGARDEPGGLGDAAGHGITGMRERARMYGGQLQAGPRPEGGFRVAARFPLTGTPA